MNIEKKKINDLIPASYNPRKDLKPGDVDYEKLKRSMEEFGYVEPIIWNKLTGHVVGGHQRLKILKMQGVENVECVIVEFSETQEKALNIALNKISGDWDFEKLNQIIDDLKKANFDISFTGFDPKDFDKIIEEYKEEPRKTLAERFGIPPLSVLDTRNGDWQKRKKAWRDIGIESQVGREDNLVNKGKLRDFNFYSKKKEVEKDIGRKIDTEEFINKYYIVSDKGIHTGTSIFDPVLCELIYNWFSREDDVVLDPFAGGSVRGVISSLLKRKYFGVDLRQEQIKANLQQLSICSEPLPKWIIGNSLNINQLTDNVQVDLIFSCPPYVDLEVYSDLPEDLSNMAYPDFLENYREIITKTCSQLKENRFACFVVGEARDKNGNYYGFVGDTVKAFCDAGLNFYNDAVLVNRIGATAMCVPRTFESMRKLYKVHQNVLIFIKGDPKKAVERLGHCDFGKIFE